MKASQFIEQIMVFGEGEKHASALIVPAFEHIRTWAQNQGLNCSSNDDICSNKEVIEAISSDVKGYNENFGQTEQIKKFELVNCEWSVEGGELTPTMKPKRKPILAKYDHLVKKIYS
jgi:long-chain acyl-CoA synthetase